MTWLCGTCDGDGVLLVGKDGKNRDDLEQCPSCSGSGVVIPDRIIEAAAKAAWPTYDWAWSEDAEVAGRELWKVCLEKTRRALVVAAKELALIPPVTP